MARLKGISSHKKEKTYEEISGIDKSKKLKENLSNLYKSKGDVYNSQERIVCQCLNCKNKFEKNIKATRKLWCNDCTEKRRKINYEKWIEKNREKEKQRKNKWYIKNKDSSDRIIKRKENDKRYYNNHKERCNQRCKNYYKNHKRDILDRMNKFNRLRKKIDIQFLIKCRLRTNLAKAVLIYTRTSKILSSKKYGVDYEAIIRYLEPFPEDLSNYHIDHIKPLCSFDLTRPEEVKKAFAPENHRWLLKEDNFRKISQDRMMSIHRKKEEQPCIN